MAIKGKSRRRSKARGPALPPKPAVGARKTPLPMRKDVKRAAVILLSVLAFLGGLRVWQNDSRGDAVNEYRRKLGTAEEPFLRHLRQGEPTNFDQAIQAFSSGQVPAATFLTLTETWEKDFREAETAMRKLKPPNKRLVEAQNLIVLGVDGYVGVARLYNLAGQLKQLADAEKGVKQKAVLQQKVQVALQHADEWRKQRADEVFKAGAQMFNDLLLRYHLVEPQPTSTPQQ
ncbi:MAG: hypothetical protein WAT66_15190 [Actinomycetota bacterium]